MTVIMPPKPGEEVTILAHHKTRLRGHVSGRENGTVIVEVEQDGPIRRPFRFAPGAEISLEWKHALGVMQHTVRVEEAQPDPRPTLRLGLVGAPEPVERREHHRVPVELDVSAWTLAQPTSRLAGHTIDLSVGGALLWLPELHPFAATIELAIVLPGGQVHASARVVWRRDPALVGIDFERISPEEQQHLVEFLRTR